MPANNSTVDTTTTRWSYVTVFSLLIAISSTTLNALILILILRKKHLRSSFNIYVVSLLLANLLYASFGSTLEFVINLYPVFWPGFAACTLYLYGLWAMTSCQIFMHFVISFNRFCAAAFPVYYRYRHTSAVALYSSVGAWVVGNVFTLPGIIIDAELYRKMNLSDGCQIDVNLGKGQKDWQICVQFSTCFVIISILLMYLFIVYKQNLRRRIFPKTGGSIQIDAHTSGMVSTKKLKHSATTVLTAITVSLVVFWSPATIYYTIVPFKDGLWDDGVVAVLNILFNFQAVMDPLIMALADSEIREYIVKRWTRLRRMATKGRSVSRRLSVSVIKNT